MVRRMPHEGPDQASMLRASLALPGTCSRTTICTAASLSISAVESLLYNACMWHPMMFNACDLL